MPRRPTDLSHQIEAIIREATAQIVALVEAERETMLESLQQAVAAMDTTLQDRPGFPEALRAAIPASARRAAPAKRPPRDQWVRTADVVVQLRTLLARRKGGYRIAELRDKTQFSDMQLHRALRQLRDAGEVTKEGELRRTVYRYTGPRPPKGRKKPTANKRAPGSGSGSGSGTSRAKGRSKTALTARTARKTTTAKKSSGRRPASRKRTPPRRPTRPPRAQWVSTDEVKQAAHKALRRRKRGLRMAELCELTGYTDKQLYRAIVALVDEGTVERVGKLRNMRYLLA